MVPDRRLTGLLVLLGMSLLGCPVWGQGPEEEKKPVIKQPTLSELAKLYQDLELPLPPRDAKFAKIGIKSIFNDKPSTSYQIVWCKKTESNHQFFKDFSNYPVYQHLNDVFTITIFEKRPSVDQIISILAIDGLHLTYFPPSNCIPDLVFAIQCQILGHNDLARFFFWHCLKAAKEPLDRSLVFSAWSYWVEQLIDPVRDRRPVGAKLRQLFQKYDYLSSYQEESLDHSKKKVRFVEIVKLTLEPSRAKPGSVEALIDALVDARDNKDSEDSFSGLKISWDRKKQIEDRKKGWAANSRCDAEIGLSKLGFEAIPALIEHLDDPRLTRKSRHSNFFYEYDDILTVGEQARFILGNYLPLAKESTKDKFVYNKNDLKLMWEKIKNTDELSYLLSLIDQNKKEISKQRPQINIYQQVADRFPDKVPFVYKKILDKNLVEQNIENYIYFITDANLPHKEKVDLLLLAAKHRHFPFQRAALQGLLEVDPKICHQVCFDLMANLPQKIRIRGEDGTQPHLELVRLAFCLEDSKSREILLSSVKKLPINEKIAFLGDPFADWLRPSKNFAIEFFMLFLDDEDLYKDTEDLNKYYHLGIFKEIEVRNLAAIAILGFLGVEIRVDDYDGNVDWEGIREFVKNEVERRREEEKRK